MIKGLPRWIIDQARSHAASVDAGKPVDQKTIYRTRSDPIQTDNFLHDFISQPTYLQDVAFGTKKLRLESGEEIVTSAAVRTVIRSRIIRQYQTGADPAYKFDRVTGGWATPKY